MMNLDSNKILNILDNRKKEVLAGISSFSVIIILLNLIGLIPTSFWPLMVILSSLSMLFLPFYPLFFHILKNNTFTILEKLSMTIISNLCFYIIIGYVSDIILVPITGLLFLLLVILVYLVEIVHVFLKNGNDIKSNPNKFDHDLRKNLYFSLKAKFSSNGLLLALFIILVCVLNIVRFSVFFGTDAWLHIYIIKSITEINYLPLTEYHQTLGVHLYYSVFAFFSGIDVFLIPKYFVFFSFGISALIFFNLLKRIFKNTNIAIFGVFLLEFISLGFSYMMFQFWPSGLSLILSLFLFFLLYVRFQEFIKEEKPENKVIISRMSFYYPFIIIVFITSLLTHVLTTGIFLITIIWIYFIYFIKSFRRGFDLILLCGLGGLYFVFNLLGIGEGHFWFIDLSRFPWYLLVGAGVLGGLIMLFLIIRLKKSILFTTGRFTLTIRGEKSQIFKRIEDKVIIPLGFGMIVIFTTFYALANLFIFEFDFSVVIVGIEIFVLVVFGLWGVAVFQKKPRGKPFYLWGMIFGILIGVMFVFDYFRSTANIFARTLYLGAPAIIICFTSYVYKSVKNNEIRTRKVLKLFFISFLIFSVLATYFHEFATVREANLLRRDNHAISWYASNNDDSEREILICEYGWDYAFTFHDYPYNENNKSLDRRDLNEVILIQEDLFDPSNHVNENGTNILKKMKKEESSEVYMMIDDYYILNSEWTFWKTLSEEELNAYYEMGYINKIQSTKDSTGEETPLYWVI